MIRRNVRRRPKHLVGTIKGTSLTETAEMLQQAHVSLVKHAVAALVETPGAGPSWGIAMKRVAVDLRRFDTIDLIAKNTERFGEVVNMVATLERMLAAIAWFQSEPALRNATVAQCHPSTSHVCGSNDLVLEIDDNRVALCEVCDVVSSRASQNRKEISDLKNLGCSDGVPDDGIRRFICTSLEFAAGLSSPKRKKTATAAYRWIEVGDAAQTVMLELVPNTVNDSLLTSVPAPAFS